MKGGQYHSKSTECPFYKKEDRQVIFCSGIVPCSSIHVAFGHDSDCIEYKTSRCRSNYKQCNVYRMLEEINDG